jgi:hypothetical protein
MLQLIETHGDQRITHEKLVTTSARACDVQLSPLKDWIWLAKEDLGKA